MSQSVGLTRYLRAFLTWIAVLSGTYFSHAQTCSPTYVRAYGGLGDDESLFILSTPDKGAIISGRTTTQTLGDYDAFLMKITQNGTIEWTKSYGGTGYDDIIKIRLTDDGGYIALGLTKSLTNPKGQPFVLKVTSAGAIQWLNQLSSNSIGKEQPKDITVLKDGSLAVLINRDDSTINSNGLVCKLSSNGVIIWAKSFDHGKDDGFNTIIEQEDSLVVGGHASINDRDAILMKISSVDGALKWAKKYIKKQPGHDEVLNVERIAGGLAFSVTSVVTNGSNGFVMGQFKRLDDDTYYYHGFSQPSGATGLTVKDAVSRLSLDNQFIYFMNEATDRSGSELVKLNNGLPQFGRNLFPKFLQYSRMTGLDTTRDEGYWATGFFKAYDQPNREINILKLDKAGSAGSCLPLTNADFTDWGDYSISDFQWALISDIGITSNSASFVIQDLSISQKATCDSIYCPIQQPINDSCKASFLVYLRSENRVSLNDVEPSRDGGTISVGSRRDQPFITKIAASGKTQWTKTYEEFFNSIAFRRIIPTKDGNYLVLGARAKVINHGVYVHSVLIKIDDSGNVLWSKDYEALGLKVYTSVSTEDGGFIVAGVGSWGIGYTYPFMFRINANGDIVWKKYIKYETHYPIYKNLFLEGNDLYAIADTYQPSTIARLERWNATTGESIWSKRVLTSTSSMYADFVTKIKDTIYTGSYILSPQGWTYDAKIVVSKFSSDGELLGNYHLTDINYSLDAYNYSGLTEYKPFTIVRTSDNNFIVAQQVQLANDKRLQITKFQPSGSLIWSRQYPNLKRHMVQTIKNDGDNLLLGGALHHTNGTYPVHDFTAYILKTDSKGLIRKDAEGLCKSDSVSTRIEANDKITKIEWNESRTVTNALEFAVKDVALRVSTLSIEGELQCSTPSTCFDVKLAGVNSTCSIKDTLVYEIVRNPGCNAAAIWIVDTSIVTIIESTDTMIKVRPRNSGVTNIKARIQSGCSIIMPTIPLTIKLGADRLDLGSDTSICPGNTIALKAGSGYGLYKWQDGSTDSIYVVTAPGLYFVAVTDSCNNSYSDTIRVVDRPPIQFNVGEDRVKCNSDTLDLKAPEGFVSYLWSNDHDSKTFLTKSVSVNPSINTSYFIKAEKEPGCFTYDTILVKVNHSKMINIGSDTSFCLGESITLNAGNGFKTYNWNTGAQTQNVQVKASGIYSVNAIDENGCSSNDTLRVLNVYNSPSPILSKDSILCSGTTKMLDPGNGYSSYLWNDGSTSKSITINTAGKYFVQVTDGNGCKGSDTTRVTKIVANPSSFLASDTAICIYSTTQLTSLKTYNKYLWNTGSASQSINVSTAGSYSLQVWDENNCTAKDTITLLPKECMQGVYIPTAFSPNNDGKNDLFRPQVFGAVTNYSFTVYNRYGEIVFTSKQIGKGWDGTIQGISQQQDVFVWTCNYELAGEKQSQKGTVMLVR